MCSLPRMFFPALICDIRSYHVHVIFLWFSFLFHLLPIMSLFAFNLTSNYVLIISQLVPYGFPAIYSSTGQPQLPTGASQLVHPLHREISQIQCLSCSNRNLGLKLHQNPNSKELKLIIVAFIPNIYLYT